MFSVLLRAFTAEREKKTCQDDFLGTAGAYAEAESGITDPLPAEAMTKRRLYGYDPIGNRVDSTESTTVRHYCANNLNQYDEKKGHH